MQNLVDFLEKNETPFEMDFGHMTIKCHYNQDWRTNKPKFYYSFSGLLLCRKEHLQEMKKIGVKIDFSNIKIGFKTNQTFVGSGQNNCRVKITFDFEVYKKICLFFRHEGSLDMLNNHQLMKLGFNIKNSVIEKNKISNITSDLSKEQYERIRLVRRLFSEKRLSNNARECNYVKLKL